VVRQRGVEAQRLKPAIVKAALIAALAALRDFRIAD
jgi:hypothetical protein